jgi:murein L,D-transpeptidase YcbB/YkuD
MVSCALLCLLVVASGGRGWGKPESRGSAAPPGPQAHWATDPVGGREPLDMKVVVGSSLENQTPVFVQKMGCVVFVIPNDENVYLHGTPSRSLFRRARRDLSHGCIRVEHPAELAEWVLRDVPGWDREHIDEAMQGEQPTTVELEEPLTVVLFYDTLQVTGDAVVSFTSDIYGHDAELDRALAHGYPYPEAAPVTVRASAGNSRVSSSSSAGRR